MKAEWKDVEFVFVQYKDTGISILSAVDDLQVGLSALLSVLTLYKGQVSCLLTKMNGCTENLCLVFRLGAVKPGGKACKMSSPVRLEKLILVLGRQFQACG